MKAQIIAGLILLSTAAFTRAQENRLVGAKWPPPPERREIKSLPKLGSEQHCLSRSSGGEYCYEVCDSEGGKECRWLTPAEFIAYLEKREAPRLAAPFKSSPSPPPWSDREIADRLARNAAGVCRPKACQKVCENEPTPAWVTAHHLQAVWMEHDEIDGPLADGRSYGAVLATGSGYGVVPAGRCVHLTPPADPH